MTIITRLARLGIFLLVLAHVALAQAGNGSDGLLFSIEKNAKTSYVLGTIHGGVSQEQMFSPLLAGVVSHARRIVVENDVRDMARVRQALADTAFGPDGVPVDRVVDRATLEALRNYFVNVTHMVEGDKFDRARPWFLMLLMPVTDTSTDKVPSFEYGTETQLFALSKKFGIPVEEFEDMRTQYAMYNAMDDETTSGYFNWYMKYLTEHVIYERQMAEIASWTRSDLAGIEQVMAQVDAARDPYSMFYARQVIRARTDAFVRHARAMADGESGVIFAVGSEHLVGRDGMLAQLAAAGYRVRQVSGKRHKR